MSINGNRYRDFVTVRFFLCPFRSRTDPLVLLGRIWLLRLMETLSLLLNRRRRRRRFHLYWTFPRPVESWFEIHMHQHNFPEAFFRRHLRMGRDSFDNLLTLWRGYVQRENTRFRDCIPPEKVLAIGLYRIAHGGSYDNTALAMNVGKTTYTVHEAFRDAFRDRCPCLTFLLIYPFLNGSKWR